MTTIDDFRDTLRSPEANARRAAMRGQATTWLTALRRACTTIAVFALIAIGAVAVRAWLYMPASFYLPAERAATFTAKDGVVLPWPANQPRARIN